MNAAPDAVTVAVLADTLAAVAGATRARAWTLPALADADVAVAGVMSAEAVTVALDVLALAAAARASSSGVETVALDELADAALAGVISAGAVIAHALELTLAAVAGTTRVCAVTRALAALTLSALAGATCVCAVTTPVDADTLAAVAGTTAGAVGNLYSSITAANTALPVHAPLPCTAAVVVRIFDCELNVFALPTKARLVSFVHVAWAVTVFVFACMLLITTISSACAGVSVTFGVIGAVPVAVRTPPVSIVTGELVTLTSNASTTPLVVWCVNVVDVVIDAVVARQSQIVAVPPALACWRRAVYVLPTESVNVSRPAVVSPQPLLTMMLEPIGTAWLEAGLVSDVPALFRFAEAMTV